VHSTLRVAASRTTYAPAAMVDRAFTDHADTRKALLAVRALELAVGDSHVEQEPTRASYAGRREVDVFRASFSAHMLTAGVCDIRTIWQCVRLLVTSSLVPLPFALYV
jgi:hypothetical protein